MFGAMGLLRHRKHIQWLPQAKPTPKRMTKIFPSLGIAPTNVRTTMSNSSGGFGGQWTLEKLECVRAYLAAYAKVMKNQKFTTAYIDAFAGTGYTRFSKLARVPSIRLESTASRRSSGEMSRCGLGSTRPSPESSLRAASARESASTKGASNLSVGGSFAGMKAW